MCTACIFKVYTVANGTQRAISQPKTWNWSSVRQNRYRAHTLRNVCQRAHTHIKRLNQQRSRSSGNSNTAIAIATTTETSIGNTAHMTKTHTTARLCCVALSLALRLALSLSFLGTLTSIQRNARIHKSIHAIVSIRSVVGEKHTE